MGKDYVSDVVIHRLPRYYRYLEELMDEGVILITSADLSERMNVTSSQIRQDLNHFSGYGQQGIGYNVAYLHDEIGKLLGVDKLNHMIIIGANLFSRALLVFNDWSDNYVIDAVFDSTPEQAKKEFADHEILDLSLLENYIKDHPVDIAVIVTPKTESQEIADRLVESGVKAIWNFSHRDLNVPDDVSVEDLRLVESLESLSCRANVYAQG